MAHQPPTDDELARREAQERASLQRVRGFNAEDKLYSAAEIEEIIGKRVAERIRREEQDRWTGTVNLAVEAINKHVSADGAHPRLIDLLGRAVQATERMERMMVSAAPEDVAKYLPLVIEREKREALEKEERKQELRTIRNLIIGGVPTITVILSLVEVLIQWKSHH